MEVVELLQSQPDPEGGVEEVKVKGDDTQQQQEKGGGDNNLQEVQVGSQKSDTPSVLAKKEGQEGGTQKGLKRFLPSWPWAKNKLVRIIILFMAIINLCPSDFQYVSIGGSCKKWRCP